MQLLQSPLQFEADLHFLELYLQYSKQRDIQQNETTMKSCPNIIHP